MSDEIESIIAEFDKKIDNYSTTLDVLKVFGHKMCCSPGTNILQDGTICWSGRRMTTSPANVISPNKEITPDLVIKLNTIFGTIAEIKQSLPRENKFWEKHFKQLKKYDDQLVGWDEQEDELVKHDIILLVPDRLSVYVHDYVLDKFEKGDYKFNRNFAIVAYHRDDSAKSFYALRRFYGKLSDDDKDEEFRTVALVVSDSVIPFYNYYFYDYKPPLPYTMANTWDHISSYIDQDDLVEKRKNKIEFNADKLIKEIKEANCPVIINMSQDECRIENDPRNPSYPKAEWIREALEEFVNLKYLEKGEKNGKYFISLASYRRMKDPINTFKKKIAQSQIKRVPSKPDPKQLPLFTNERSQKDI